VVAHLVDDANAAVADLTAGPVEQAHAAVGLDQAIFDGHVAGSDVLPAAEIFAVEELLPRLFGLRVTGNGERRDGGEKQQQPIAHRSPLPVDIL
jgi:hypothetical protein